MSSAEQLWDFMHQAFRTLQYGHTESTVRGHVKISCTIEMFDKDGNIMVIGHKNHQFAKDQTDFGPPDAL